MNGQDILKSISKKSTEHEYYTPFPKDYKVGNTKYVIIFGTVMSGLGKGIFSASLAKLLQDKGLTVAPIKFDGYLNVDAGTLNPYRHGEVFVLDDGTECDMDLGTYERFLGLNLTKDNYLTSGKILTTVMLKERKGKYLGRDVQFIPHVTGEIKLFLRELAVNRKADVVFIEVGGTVGDVENNYFIEAMRELAYEEGPGNVCLSTLTYVLEPDFLGEQKSKAAQLGIRSLQQHGIQPHIIGCRSTNPITEKVREKISIYSNVPFNRVVGLHNVKSIYEIPSLLRKAGLDKEVVGILDLKKKIKETESKKKEKEWEIYVNKVLNSKSQITIGITGKYTGLRDSYASIIKSIEHSAAHNNTKVKIKWIETTEIENGKTTVEKELEGISGVIVPGGFGKRGAEGKIKCVEYIRKNNIPYLGLCYGFQMAIIEFARNVCNLEGANSTEIEPDCKNKVIDILPEQKKIEGLGGNMRLGGREVEIKENTYAYKLYGNNKKVTERFRHRFECNPDYIKTLEDKGLIFSGKAPKHPIMQILELKNHPFFVGVQFHPEFTSRPLVPNPLYKAFIKAALNIKS